MVCTSPSESISFYFFNLCSTLFTTEPAEFRNLFSNVSNFTGIKQFFKQIFSGPGSVMFEDFSVVEILVGNAINEQHDLQLVGISAYRLIVPIKLNCAVLDLSYASGRNLAQMK